MNPSNASTPLAASEFKDLLNKCIHCGFCLPSCPTYEVFGTEMDSPRGRIALMRAASEGLIQLDGAFTTHIDRCLMCRACESACPSGVPYGTMVETARVALEQQRKPGTAERVLRWIALRNLMPHRGRLHLLAWALRFYQRSGLQSLATRLHLLPKAIRNAQGLLPPLSAARPEYRKPAPAMGERRGQVAFFYGCVQDAFLGGVNAATVRVLQRNGYEVHFPGGQTCCGAAQLHVGEEELFRDLARRNIGSFPANEYAAFINNAGGCGSTLKEYGHLLRDDARYAEKARRFSARVKDINEFLTENLHVLPQGAIHARVVYSDSCHLRHVQKVVAQPRHLLQQIPGLELVELGKPDRCCGSAGVYNLVQAETASAILDEKMADITSTGADIIVITNTGCHLQLLHGVRRAGLKMRVAHVVELLDESYRAGNEVLS